jgi:Trk K+ transport system NAD-binding subunit
VLRRAKVPTAHSVVILTDEREGKHADGKSVLTCIAIRNICRGETQPNVSAECRNPNNRQHLRKAGADEIISSDGDPKSSWAGSLARTTRLAARHRHGRSSRTFL